MKRRLKNIAMQLAGGAWCEWFLLVLVVLQFGINLQLSMRLCQEYNDLSANLVFLPFKGKLFIADYF